MIFALSLCRRTQFMMLKSSSHYNSNKQVKLSKISQEKWVLRTPMLDLEKNGNSWTIFCQSKRIYTVPRPLLLAVLVTFTDWAPVFLLTNKMSVTSLASSNIFLFFAYVSGSALLCFSLICSKSCGLYQKDSIQSGQLWSSESSSSETQWPKRLKFNLISGFQKPLPSHIERKNKSPDFRRLFESKFLQPAIRLNLSLLNHCVSDDADSGTIVFQKVWNLSGINQSF